MSAQVMEGQKIGNRRAISLLPWLLLALIAILGGAAILFLFANQQGAGRESVASLFGDLFRLIGAIVTCVVGALIAASRPRNPIGWLQLGIAAFLVVSAASGGYAVYALITQPGALPIGLWAAWVAQWIWIGQVTLLVFILLVFPTGHLLSRRWRLVAYAGIVIIAVGALLNALSQQMIIGNGPSATTFANPIGVSDIDAMLPPAIFPVILVSLVGILFAALASLVIRFRRAQGDERQQLKWFTYAAALAVPTIPVSIIFGDWAETFSNIVFLAPPLAIGVAILKYRLYDIDLLINRTLVYIPLTAILAGIFAASITLSQKLFVALTGAASDAATVLTTLIVVAVFTPLKDRLQALVDRRFKEASDPAKKLNAFGEFVRVRVSAVSAPQITRRLLEEAVGAFEAKGGAAYLGTDAQPFYTFGEWHGDAQLNVPLQDGTSKLGSVALGARRNGAEYAAQDRATLQQIADLTARAMALDERANGVRQ